MNGYSPTDVSIAGKVLGASVTDEPVTKEFHITAGGSRNLVIKLAAASVTVGGGITAKLQTAVDNDWVDSKTVAVTASGNFYIKLLENAAADHTYLPLLGKGRLVLTTGAGSAITVSSVNVLQDL